MRMTIAVVAVALLVSAPAGAQQRTERAPYPDAVRELLEVARVREQTAANLHLMHGGMAETGPAGAKMAAVMSQFMDEFLPWQALEPEFVRLYQELFTEDELRQLTAFYRTPLGQKLIDTTPRLTEQTMTATRRLLEPHMPELQRRIMAAMFEGAP